jgi:hypothetical protein
MKRAADTASNEETRVKMKRSERPPRDPLVRRRSPGGITSPEAAAPPGTIWCWISPLTGVRSEVVCRITIDLPLQAVLGTLSLNFSCTTMKRFFFDLVGDVPARDFMGHECSSKTEAKRHAAFVAHRIGTEHPSFGKPGNRISVRDERGAEIYAVPIASPTRHV